MATGKLALAESILVYPVLAFDRYSFGVKRDVEELTVVWTSLIRSGWFVGLQIADSDGKTFEVASARKLHSVGFLWGFNPLYGRRVKVELKLRQLHPSLTLEEIRSHLLALLRTYSPWKSRDDYDELLAAVSNADSISRLITALSKAGV